MNDSSRYNRRRFLAFGLSGAATAAVLAACSQAPATPPTPQAAPTPQTIEVTKVVTQVVQQQVVVTATPAPAAGPKQIVFMTDWAAGGRGKSIDTLLGMWKDRFPNITVKDERQADGLDYTKQLAANTLGDVTLANGHQLAPLGKQGVFTDIGDVLKKYQFNDADLIPHEFFYKWNGAWIGLPFQLNLFDWTVNKDVIENAGLQVPDGSKWTWDDMLDIAKKVTVPEKKVWGIKWVDFGDTPTWWTRVIAAGGDVISQDGMHTAFVDSPGADAIRDLYDWIYKWKVMTPWTHDYYNKEYWGTDSNTWAFHFGGASKNLLKENNKKYNGMVILPPADPKTGKKISQLNAQPHWVTKYAKTHDVVEQATQFVMFTTSPDAMKVVVSNGGVPTLKSIAYTGAWVPNDQVQVVLASDNARVDLEDSRTAYWSNWWKLITAPMNDAFYEGGKISVNDAFAKVKSDGDKALSGA